MTLNRQATLGAFVLGGLALVAGAFVFFGNFHFFNPQRRAVVIFQDAINGLSVGAPVAFRGVRLGAVQSISLKFDRVTHKAYIPVAITIDPSRVTLVGGDKSDKTIPLATLVRIGLRAELNTQSFVTGQSEIDLDFDPSTPAVLQPGLSDLPEVPTKLPSIALIKQQLTELPLRQLADSGLRMVTELQSVADTLKASLPALIGSAEGTSARAQQTLQTADATISELRGRSDRLIDDLDRLSTTASAQLNGRGADLHRVLALTGRTLEQATRQLSDLQGLTGPRSSARLNLESTLRDLAAATASLRGLAGDVEQNPQLLLTGRRP